MCDTRPVLTYRALEMEPCWTERAIKESYPDAIVFHEAEGLFVVRGSRYRGHSPRVRRQVQRRDGWLRKHGCEETFERFKRWLHDGDRRSLREYGELYVYQVGDWHEVDWELTTDLPPNTGPLINTVLPLLTA
ncbi:MAG: hypothetical protein Q7R39_11185 [Dehalococcoidia bacterium]|nr:hypothetical protein [Dehalococcoidia bacterium]